MTDSERFSKRLERGLMEVWLRPDGVWGLSWSPDLGVPGYPGVTYTSEDDPHPADDFPTEYDARRLLDWGRARWGNPPPD